MTVYHIASFCCLSARCDVTQLVTKIYINRQNEQLQKKYDLCYIQFALKYYGFTLWSEISSPWLLYKCLYQSDGFVLVKINEKQKSKLE